MAALRRSRARRATAASMLVLAWFAVAAAADPATTETGVADADAGSAADDAAEAAGWRDDWSLHARLRQTAAVETEGGRAQKAEFELRPTLEGKLPWGWELTAIARLRGDPLGRLEPGRPNQSTYAPETERLLIGDDAELELRELYVERAVGRGYLVVGKQQVVWGKADGLKVLDVVDPQSYREFILADFSESRIPLWTLNFEHPVGPLTAQLLWIPDTTVHDIPEAGAVFEIKSSQLVPTPPPNIPVVTANARRPKEFFEDSDAGLKLSGHVRDWDLSLNYLWHYDDVPALHRSLSIGPSGLRVDVTPRYERTHVVGTTFATAIGDFTLRGEAAVFSDRYVSTSDVFDGDGLEKSPEYSCVIGLDWFGLAPRTFLSMQVFESIVPGLSRNAIRDEVVTITTLLARHTFADGAGLVQAMWLEDPAEGDGLVRGEIRYELRPDLIASIGADFFYGPNSGIFGEFDGRDRFVFALETGL